MADCLGWRLQTFRATEWDYCIYEARAYEILTSPRGRAAILEGGLIWRLALEIFGNQVHRRAVEGPSEGVSKYAHKVAVGRETYFDDALTPEEIDIICGTYKIAESSSNDPTHLSWWPRPTQWMSSGLNLGHWSQLAERWFVRRLDSIRRGNALPLSGKTWKSNMRFHSGAIKLRYAVHEESELFLSKVLLPTMTGL
ncbi:hypothetical protein C8Q79DRAFT_914497 [Trametes meyenii]|nr:hypothetical protein C8Q79DRAFT_914497 [Trametes meyenii]